MPMTVVITRNMPDKYRGFLASCMLEAAPGVYTNPRLNAGVRDRVWAVMQRWFDGQIPDGSIVMVWADPSQPGGQGVEFLGLPPRTVLDYDGVLISRLSKAEFEEDERTQEIKSEGTPSAPF